MILTDVMPLPRNWLLNVLPKDFHLAFDIHIPCADKAKEAAPMVNYCMEEKNKRKEEEKKKEEEKIEREKEGKKE